MRSGVGKIVDLLTGQWNQNYYARVPMNLIIHPTVNYLYSTTRI